jgi:mRNA interferase YafQ
MRKPSFTRQFEKDLRRMEKRGKNLQKIKEVMGLLIAEAQLSERQRDHPLIGNYKNRRECHIEPNWLLIYKLDEKGIIFERTGTHSDLFE